MRSTLESPILISRRCRFVERRAIRHLLDSSNARELWIVDDSSAEFHPDRCFRVGRRDPAPATVPPRGDLSTSPLF